MQRNGSDSFVSRIDKTATSAIKPWQLGTIACFGLVLMIPLVVAPVPILGDYTNHLARWWLLGGGIDQMADVYSVDWSRARTNIGGDIVVWLLKGLVPGDRVAQGLLAFAIIGPPLGVLLLNLRLQGWNAWQFVFPALAWTQSLLWGFVTFQLGLALALILATADGIMPNQPLRWGFRFVASMVLLVVHPFALLFFAALLAGLTLGPRLTAVFASRQAFRRFAGSTLGLIICCALPTVLLVVSDRGLPGAGQNAAGDAIVWNASVVGRLAAMTSPVRIHDYLSDGVFVVLLISIPAVALLKRRLCIHQGLMAVAVLLMVLSFFMPTSIAGTNVIQVRLPIMGLLTAVAATGFAAVERRTLIGIGVVLALLSGVRTLNEAWHWAGYERDMRSLRQVLEALPLHSKLLPLIHDASKETARTAPIGRYYAEQISAFSHATALAIVWRQAFVPNLFTARGKQPLVVLPPYTEISVTEGYIASAKALADPDFPLLPEQSYVRLWRERFDYALVINADLPDKNGPITLPPGVEIVASDGFVQLLRLPMAAR